MHIYIYRDSFRTITNAYVHGHMHMNMQICTYLHIHINGYTVHVQDQFSKVYKREHNFQQIKLFLKHFCLRVVLVAVEGILALNNADDEISQQQQ